MTVRFYFVRLPVTFHQLPFYSSHLLTFTINIRLQFAFFNICKISTFTRRKLQESTLCMLPTSPSA